MIKGQRGDEGNDGYVRTGVNLRNNGTTWSPRTVARLGMQEPALASPPGKKLGLTKVSKLSCLHRNTGQGNVNIVNLRPRF